MAIVPAKCTQCGATIEVDNTLEASVCKYCGSAFVVEKAITNHTNSFTNNINANNVNVYNIVNENVKGELTIHSYTGSYLVNPSIKIYKNGEHIVNISKGETLKLNINEDCEITFKCMFRKTKYFAKKNVSKDIKLDWDRKTGHLVVKEL